MSHSTGRSLTFLRMLVRASYFVILFLTVQAVTAQSAPLEDASSPAGTLLRIRTAHQKDYSSIVFHFGTRVHYEKPVVDGDAIAIRFKNAKTKIPPQSNFEKIDSWVSLEADGKDLKARIGLPENFREMRCFTRPGPFRLIVRLYRQNRPASSEGEPDDKAKPPGHSTSKMPPAEKNILTLSKLNGLEKIEDGKLSNQVPAQGLLTLNFYQCDIRELLLAVAMKRDINIVMSQDITGKVSVHLYQIPLEEALGAIAAAGGFSHHKKGAVYYFYKPKNVKDPQADRLQMRVFKLKFASIDKVQDILAGIPGVRTIKIHEPTKTIVVEDTPENMAKIEMIINSWDTMPRQVLIEAKILQVTLTDDMKLGVNWSKVLGDATIKTTGFSTGLATQTGLGVGVTTAAGSAHAFSAALDALQSVTTIDILSTPKILASHGKTAKVQVGGKQGYKVTTSNLGVTTETIQFIDTGTILEITPFIDDANNIYLDVKPSINAATVDPVTLIPSQTTTAVTTSLMAKNGETVFIGGLMEDQKTLTRNMVPCLGSIPGLGILFGRINPNINKKELVVLITPQVIEAELKRQTEEVIERSKRTGDKLKKEPLPAYKYLWEGTGR